MTEPPRAMGIPRGFGRKGRIHTALAQLLIASPPTFPLFLHDTPQLPAYPAVKIHQHRRRLAGSKIPMPAPQIDVEIFNHSLQVNAPRAPRSFPYSILESNQRFRSYAPSVWFFHGKTEAQEFTLPWPRRSSSRSSSSSMILLSNGDKSP